MFLFDSHCHLDDSVFMGDLEEVVDRATSNRVFGMTVVGVDEPTSLNAVALSKKYSCIYSSVGFHPHNASKCNSYALERLKKVSNFSKVVAWGEIGLDFNRMYSEKKQQEVCLVEQISIADSLNLPIIFHERDTKGRLIDILNVYPNLLRSAVVHCFSGNYQEMRSYLELGFYIGVTGILTIKQRGQLLRNLVKYVPLDKLLIETDAPYLTPAPYKNKIKRNEPSFVKTVLLKLADILGENTELIANQLWENTCNFFRVKPEFNE